MIENIDFVNYYIESIKIGDVDPSLKALQYVSDRWEFTLEERYLLSFYYSTCYSSVTAYYLKNEFPDFQSLDLNRIKLWWNKNKKNCVFQTDRFKVKSMDKFVSIVESYKNMILKKHSNQTDFFMSKLSNKPTNTYNNLFDYINTNLYYTGRFTCFIYLESLWRICNLKNYPNKLVLQQAEACKNGLSESVSKRYYNSFYNDKKLNNFEYQELYKDFWKVYKQVKKQCLIDNLPFDIFKLETVLCAYYKYKKYPTLKNKNKIRYIGYYLDRELDEIQFMESRIKGINWNIFYQYRKESYNNDFLLELSSNNKYRYKDKGEWFV